MIASPQQTVYAGFLLPWEAIALVLMVGVVGNFLFGLDQRRRLLGEIKRAIVLEH